MSFEMNGVAIHSQLLERYAKLSSAGGYELLLYQRFHQLPPPHSPSRIKEIANASVVYIRPLQRDILDTEDSSSLHDSQRSLCDELHDLQKNFDNGPKEKLKVDEEDLLNDAITYYKDPDFNPSKRLRIVYTGQPADDTDGVVHHSYTKLFTVITDTFFQGEEYRSPIYNGATAASGLIKFVGTIIVHSILQGGPGFPVFSPGIYYYLAKGNVEEAMESLTVIDCSLEMRDFISKIAGKDVTYLHEKFDEEVTTVLANCGLQMKLTNDNKMRVIRNLIVHDAIAKPKMVLDQLRGGLKTLGFGKRMELYPDIYIERRK
ncbi:G2/M phase-specific E3 ubiquitin-protein ligase-like [Acropora muricata]|uniref:G2/M phase-specific E3 ubiquitin-protein ligase-like n=1 Tax=Acropora muricata TaxID=159855 RepID=UPI0034E53006